MSTIASLFAVFSALFARRFATHWVILDGNWGWRRKRGEQGHKPEAHRKQKMVEKEPGRAVVGSGVVSAAGQRRELRGYTRNYQTSR